MKKLIAVSIRNSIDSKETDIPRIIEIKDIEKYLNDGYNITSYEVVVTPASSIFTVIYQLEKLD